MDRQERLVDVHRIAVAADLRVVLHDRDGDVTARVREGDAELRGTVCKRDAELLVRAGRLAGKGRLSPASDIVISYGKYVKISQHLENFSLFGRSEGRYARRAAALRPNRSALPRSRGPCQRRKKYSDRAGRCPHKKSAGLKSRPAPRLPLQLLVRG